MTIEFENENGIDEAICKLRIFSAKLSNLNIGHTQIENGKERTVVLLWQDDARDNAKTLSQTADALVHLKIAAARWEKETLTVESIK